MGYETIAEMTSRVLKQDQCAVGDDAEVSARSVLRLFLLRFAFCVLHSSIGESESY